MAVSHNVLTGLQERLRPSQQETFQRQQCGAFTQKRKRAREASGERRTGEGGMCPGRVMQQQGRESMGQRAPKGSSRLGASIATEFILCMASSCCIQCHEVCKAGRL